ARREAPLTSTSAPTTSRTRPTMIEAAISMNNRGGRKGRERGSVQSENIDHGVQSGWFFAQPASRRKGPGRIAVTIGCRHSQLKRLSQHSIDDRMLARVVAGADRVIA